MVKDYYDRADHRDVFECIMSLKNPEQSLEKNKEVLGTLCLRITDKVFKSGLYHLKRDENSTVENSLALLENHFKLA